MRNEADDTYLSLAQDIIDNGVVCENRTGVDTKAVFGRQARYDCSDGKIPILTTKKVGIKMITNELLWFIRGDTNNRWLREQGTTIWDEWSDKHGDLGPVYGAQMRGRRSARMGWETFTPITEGAKCQMLVAYRNAKDVDVMPTCPQDLGLRGPGMPGLGLTGLGLEGKDFVLKASVEITAHENSEGRVYTWIGDVTSDKHPDMILIKFTDTGSVRMIHHAMLETGTFVDYYAKHGGKTGQVPWGYYGQQGKYPVNPKVRKLWKRMLETLDRDQITPRWASMETFATDIASIPGYAYWVVSPDDYEFVSGWNGLEGYAHPEHCIFAPRDVSRWREVDARSYLDDEKKEVVIPAHTERRVFYIDQLAAVVERLKTNPG